MHRLHALALVLPMLGMLMLAPAWVYGASSEPIAVGSKRFTESYVLGELLMQTVQRAGARAVHRTGLGTTGIVLAALETGSIDVYVEYTGTIARDILNADPAIVRPTTIEQLDRLLRPRGLGVAVPLGFNNSYALAMPRALAQRLGVRRVSDLASHPQLRLGFTQEFLALPAGWPGLAHAYGLPHRPVGIEHALAYEAMATGRIDVKEVYTTDAQIAQRDLLVLEDDRQFFPRYDAVLLYRLDLPARFPIAWQALRELRGRIDEATMMRLNAAVEIERRSFADAARSFFAPVDRATAPTATSPQRSLWKVLAADDVWRLTAQHLLLVGASLAASILIGVPLGVIAFRRPALGVWILGAVGVAQTVPSLALLALLIAAFGTIGTQPALVALSVYALLPIVRNTQAGLAGVGPGLRDAARALGLRRRDRLWAIDLPLALPVILAGVQTSAVLSVGTATIAAFVGAGGYGERIVQGLATNDASLLLAGALPSSALALLVQAAFAVIGRRLARGAPGEANRPAGRSARD